MTKLIPLCMIMVLVSCTAPAYLPNHHPAPIFESQGDIVVAGNLPGYLRYNYETAFSPIDYIGHNYEIAFSPIDHIGLIGSREGSFKDAINKSKFSEVSLGYYRNVNASKYSALYLSYGRGSSKASAFTGRLNSDAEHRNDYAKGKYYRISGSLLGATKHEYAYSVASIRVSYVEFTSYSHYEDDWDDGKIMTITNDQTNAFFIEPSIGFVIQSKHINLTGDCGFSIPITGKQLFGYSFFNVSLGLQMSLNLLGSR